MKAVDTNVLARFIVRDDEVQAKVADDVLRSPFYIADTVLLETAWLLSSRYRVRRTDLVATLTDLLALPTATVSDAAWIGWALDRVAAGADVADMMHLVSARAADGFVSFDRDLSRYAGPDTPVLVEEPSA